MLRPVVTTDIDYLYAEEVSGDLAFRWRLGGAHPNPYTYAESLWNGVLASFIATDRLGQRRMAVFTAYNADLRNQFVYVGGALLSEAPSEKLARAAVAIEGFSLVLDYVFSGFPFRKIYFEVGEYNLPQFQSVIGRLAVEEGRLASHLFFDWNWWDLVTLAVWRDAWEKSRYRERMGA